MFRGVCEIQKLLLWCTKKTKTYLAFDVKMELPQRRVYVYIRKQGKKQNILISKYCHVVVAVLASAQLWKWTTSRRDFGASEVRYHFELFMGLKSWVELTPPRPRQLGRYPVGEGLILLNSSELKNLASECDLISLKGQCHEIFDTVSV